MTSIAETTRWADINRTLYDAIEVFLLRHFRDKYALIVKGKLIDIYDSGEDAYRHASRYNGGAAMLIQKIIGKD